MIGAFFYSLTLFISLFFFFTLLLKN